MLTHALSFATSIPRTLLKLFIAALQDSVSAYDGPLQDSVYESPFVTQFSADNFCIPNLDAYLLSISLNPSLDLSSIAELNEKVAGICVLYERENYRDSTGKVNHRNTRYLGIEVAINGEKQITSPKKCLR